MLARPGKGHVRPEVKAADQREHRQVAAADLQLLPSGQHRDNEDEGQAHRPHQQQRHDGARLGPVRQGDEDHPEADGGDYGQAE